MTTAEASSRSKAAAWQVVGATFAIQLIISGTGFYADGVLLTSLADALDTDRFEISLGLTLQILIAGLLGPVVGLSVSRYSVRSVMIAGSALFATGVLLLSQVSTLSQFYAAKLVIAIGLAFAGPLPCSVLIVEWFEENRGTAMGLSQLGATLGGTAFIPALTWSIAAYGWRPSLLWLGIASAILLPLTVAVFIRRPHHTQISASAGADAPATRQLLRDPGMWMLVSIFGLCFAGTFAVIQVLHSHATDRGFGLGTAALVMALLTGAAATAKPMFGALADWSGPTPSALLGVLLQALGLALIITAGSSGDVLLIAGAVLFGLGYGGLPPLMSLLVGETFGNAGFARALGLMGVLLLPANFVGFPLATLVHGQVGSYQPAFAGFIFMYLAAAALLVRARSRARTRFGHPDHPPST